MEIIKIKIKLKQDASLPVYMTEGSSGADMCALYDIKIKAFETKLIPTGIYIEIPFGYECQIRPRSGLSLKHQIIILNSPGTIDSDYRGEIKIIMHNLSKKDYFIKKGDRIAQMVFAPVCKAEFIIQNELKSTNRDKGGFGHTDKI